MLDIDIDVRRRYICRR